MPNISVIRLTLWPLPRVNFLVSENRSISRNVNLLVEGSRKLGQCPAVIQRHGELRNPAAPERAKSASEMDVRAAVALVGDT